MDELARLRSAGYTTHVGTWHDVLKRFGSCVVSKLACIIKVKRDGRTKIRLVIDFRRSGVNGHVKAAERVVLPRIADVLSDGM